MPELPDVVFKKFVAPPYSLSEYNANVIVPDPAAVALFQVYLRLAHHLSHEEAEQPLQERKRNRE